MLSLAAIIVAELSCLYESEVLRLMSGSADPARQCSMHKVKKLSCRAYLGKGRSGQERDYRHQCKIFRALLISMGMEFHNQSSISGVTTTPVRLQSFRVDQDLR
jgi:hypothetical protein